MNPLTIVGGLVLLFLAPGFLLLAALFPGRRYFDAFHPIALPALSVVASVAILIVAGTILGFLPGGPGGLGWFQGNQDGAPVIELTLGGLCVVLFAVAWWRGAFPLLGRSAEYPSWTERGEPEEVTRLRGLRLEEERLRKEAIRVRRRARESRDVGVRTALNEAADELDAERKTLGSKARAEEEAAGERRYGKKASSQRWRLTRR
ncbi:MAG: hypothetical protein QOE90_725 [Thermoplasmata archaeon]|nr:hypothetical protein [Thermoplasmata archaeon]